MNRFSNHRFMSMTLKAVYHDHMNNSISGHPSLKFNSKYFKLLPFKEVVQAFETLYFVNLVRFFFG